MIEDFDSCYRAIRSRDARFDGWFVLGVTSTGIYCRPSCPAMTPKREHVRLYPTSAAAQGEGYRACLRCRPDAAPGSPEWDTRADVVGRAMRLIADGLVDRAGVGGLARELGYSERHLARQLAAEVGATPIALARAQRAQTARVLIETTDVPFTDVAFASGFGSIRQFNDTVQAVFARSPRDLRAARRTTGTPAPGTLSVRLPVRPPFDGVRLIAFLGARAVPGVEALDPDGTYRRALSLPHAGGTVALRPGDAHVTATLALEDLRDLPAAVQRCRRLLDLDADPVAIAAQLGSDPLIGALVRARPGLRVPGTVDGAELAFRAILGQQVSVAGARTLAGRLAQQFGEKLARPADGIELRFPAAESIAAADPAALGLTGARGRALVALAEALADGSLALHAGADRAEARTRLLAIPGIGPWTADYIALRALGDPDAFLPADLGVRHALERLGVPGDPRSAAATAERWRPWRASAVLHLWTSLDPSETA